MVSAIDATKPTATHAYTADVRANFAAAKSEIEALQQSTTGGPFLPIAGVTPMTGPLLLAADPTLPLGALTKQYIDRFGGFVDVLADPLGAWNQPGAVTRNTMFGVGAGVRLDTTALGWNTFIGHQAGNAMIGSSGTTPTTTENVMIGTLSGANQPSGDFNTYLGNVTGWGCNYDSDNCTYLGMDVFRGSPEFSKVTTATVVAGGTGGTPGPVTITGTSGVAGTKWQGTATISAGGALTGPVTITVPGGYSTVPTATDPVTGGGLTGATCAVATSLGIWNGGSNNTGVGARVMRNGNYEQCCTLGAFTMQYQNATGALVTINNCIAIGYGSMTGDPTALGTIANCVSVGWFTGANLGKGMASAATVQGNVFIGTAAGRYVQSGNYNTLVGYNSGASPSMAATAFATCVGANTGALLTTGNQLTAVGFNAASKVTTGNANTLFGYQAGLALTTGSFNHIFGNSAGGALIGGNRNTLIGHLAASTNLTTGSDNIIIGYGLDTVAAATGSTINIGNTFLATVAGGPTSNARIELAGLSVAFFNSLFTSTAQGISIDVPNQLVTAIAVAAGGTGYLANDTLNDASGGRYSVTSVSGGAVTGLSIIKPGVTNAPPVNPVTLTNGSKTTASNQAGTGCTATLTWSANKALQLNASANDVLVGSGTTSNAATVGFLGLPASPGVPTGTPLNAALQPLVKYNSGTDTVNIFANGAWRHIATLPGAA
jgi:hypothetical protein